METVEISSNPERLDVKFIYDFISRSYWAGGRAFEEIEICINHSVNFGVYLDGRQIGYARVVTDTVAFAYLMDVFIDESHRGKGYSKQLIGYVLNCPELKNVKTLRLATTDAHGLYQKFGFRPLAEPHKMMELKR